MARLDFFRFFPCVPPSLPLPPLSSGAATAQVLSDSALGRFLTEVRRAASFFQGDTAAQQAMPADHRRREKEVMADFIQKKREIFLVQVRRCVCPCALTDEAALMAALNTAH